MTKEFKSAIIWGFWLSVSALVRAILAQIALYYKLFILLWVSYFMFAINIALVVMLFTFMNVWRWAHEGRVCSGDFLGSKKGADESIYLIGEGRFLKIILFMVYFVILLATLAICTAVCAFKNTAEKRAEEEDSEANKKKRFTAWNVAIDHDFE